MRSSITSSLRIKEMGKTCFPLGKIEFLGHWNSVYTTKFLAKEKPKQTAREMKALKYKDLHSAMIL